MPDTATAQPSAGGSPRGTRSLVLKGARWGAVGGLFIGGGILAFSIVRLFTNSQFGGENIELGMWYALFTGYPFSLALSALQYLPAGHFLFTLLAPVPNGLLLGALSGAIAALIRSWRTPSSGSRKRAETGAA